MTLLYEKESYDIRGVVFDIYKQLRSGHKEKVYQNALYLGLREKGLDVDKEQKIKIYYTGKDVGTYVPDFIINRTVLIELKAKPKLLQEDIKQFWQYLKGSGYKLGFLINFGARNGVEIVRRVYDTARTQHFLPRSSA
ncbi:GxxExxY protein [Candidatus Omnitrophota bacterium]